MRAAELRQEQQALAARTSSAGQLSSAASDWDKMSQDLEQIGSDSGEIVQREAEGVPEVSSPTRAAPHPGAAPLPAAAATRRPPLAASGKGKAPTSADSKPPSRQASGQDLALRDLHDPIEGDSADISWRGNADVKRKAAKEAKQHDLAGDNPRDFDPEKVLQEIDQAVHKMAGQATATAREVTSKLWGGATEAKTGLSRLAGDVSSWWATLDPGAASSATSAASTPAGSVSMRGADQASLVLQEQFGLDAGEELLERFPCSLQQTYTCPHNAFTPAQQVSFPGTLYITAGHTCFASCTRDGQEVSVLVAHKDTKRAGKVRLPGQRTGASLKLDLGRDKWLIFDEFAGEALDSALGLIEHLSGA